MRVIGVEPTRREALAPETSVSTISPHALDRNDKDMNIFSNYNIELINFRPAFYCNLDPCTGIIYPHNDVLQVPF